MPNVSAAPSEPTVQISPATVALRPANPIPRSAEVPPLHSSPHTAPHSKARLAWFLSGGAAALALAAALWFLGSQLGLLGHDKRDELPPEAAKTRNAGVTSVTVAPVAFRTVRRTVEAVGTLHAYEQITISPKVEGRILKIHHEVADRVKPGDVLFELDAADYELSVRQAAQSLQVELAKLGLDQLPPPSFDVGKLPAVVQAHTRAENAAARMERSRALAARNAVTAEDLADKVAEHRVAQSEYENQLLIAKGNLATALTKQEALAIAQQQLSETVVRVPTPTQPIPNISERGVYAVSMRSVAEGSFVRPGAEAFRLVIDQTLKMRAAVPEQSGAEVELGQTADVFASAHGKPVSGKVTRINPVIDSATRTFEVEIQIDNSRGTLKPGGFAKTGIHVRDEETAAIPLEAVVKFAGITKIFLAKQGKAEEVQVTLGIQGDTWVEVMSPTLPRGAQVITSGQSALADGAGVEVRNVTKKSAKDQAAR